MSFERSRGKWCVLLMVLVKCKKRLFTLSTSTIIGIREIRFLEINVSALTALKTSKSARQALPCIQTLILFLTKIIESLLTGLRTRRLPFLWICLSRCALECIERFRDASRHITSIFSRRPPLEHLFFFSRVDFRVKRFLEMEGFQVVVLKLQYSSSRDRGQLIWWMRQTWSMLQMCCSFFSLPRITEDYLRYYGRVAPRSCRTVFFRFAENRVLFGF